MTADHQLFRAHVLYMCVIVLTVDLMLYYHQSVR